MSREKGGNNTTNTEDLGYGDAAPDTEQRNNAEQTSRRRFERRGATAGTSEGTVEIRKRGLEQDAAADNLADAFAKSDISEPPAKRRKTDSQTDSMEIDHTEHEDAKRTWQKREDDRGPRGGGQGMTF